MTRGTHHRPSQTKKRAVQAGATTGVGLSLAMFTPGTAQASTLADWRALAACETGDRENGVPVLGTERWDTNTGNGYFGGLQFSQQTWEAAGGIEFAQRADLATDLQQIQVADSWLARVAEEQGLYNAWASQWPDCSERMNLRAVEPGLVTDEVPPAPPEVPDAEVPAPDPLPEPPEPPVTPAEPTAPVAEVTNFEHTVVEGDWISKIAQQYGICTPDEDIRTCWEDFAAQNADVAPDPHRIVPGMVLTYSGAALPTPPVDVDTEEPTVPPAPPVEEAPPPPVPPVADDLDCGDFPDQAAAQAKLDEDSSDPHRLDQDGDGQACEVFFASPAEEGPVVSAGFADPLPGRVATGDGLGAGRGHDGQDWPAPGGTPVYAAHDGVVNTAGGADADLPGYSGYGGVIDIQGDGFITRYAHLSGFEVSPGDTVLAGELIGYVGSTGQSTGNHLHFEVRQGTNPYGPVLDPITWLQEREVL